MGAQEEKKDTQLQITLMQIFDSVDENHLILYLLMHYHERIFFQTILVHQT